MNRRWIIAGSVTAALLLAAGAAAVYARPTPAKAAEAFLEAARTGDGAAYEATFTTKARSAGKEAGMPLRVEVTPAGDEAQRARLRVGATRQKADTADVALVDPSAPAGARPLRLKMRKEEGQWRIHAVVAPIAGTDTEVTLDYENPATIPMDLLAGMARGWGATVIGEGLQALGKGLQAAGQGLMETGKSMAASGAGSGKP